MAREYQNGDNFGYVLGFRKKDASSWTMVRIPHVESSRYVYYNETVTPYSPFEVKIKAYNRRGEGPFSQIAVVHSAEEGETQLEHKHVKQMEQTLWDTETGHRAGQMKLSQHFLEKCNECQMFPVTFAWLFALVFLLFRNTVPLALKYKKRQCFIFLFFILIKHNINLWPLKTWSTILYINTRGHHGNNSKPSHSVQSVSFYPHCTPTLPRTYSGTVQY